MAVKSVQPLGKGQAVLSQDHRREWPFGSTTHLSRDERSLRVGSRTTTSAGTQDSQTQRCRVSSMICTRRYLRHSKKYIDWKQTRIEQGDVAHHNNGQSVVQQRGQFADKNWATRCHERRTQERTIQTKRSSSFIQKSEKEAISEGPCFIF